MPYKRHAPCSEAEMEVTCSKDDIAVFQILKDIYHMTDDEGIKMKCRIGISMAYAMRNKLLRYEKVFGSQKKE